MLRRLVAALVVLVAALPASAVINRYVRTDGSNANCNGQSNAAYPGSGSGLTCAYQTIDFCADSGVGGDDYTCNVADGNYNENVTLGFSCTLADRCTIKSTNIHGAHLTNVGSGHAITGGGRSYWTFDGLWISVTSSGAPSCGRGISVDGNGTEILNVKLEGHATCIFPSIYSVWSGAGLATTIVIRNTSSDHVPAGLGTGPKACASGANAGLVCVSDADCNAISGACQKCNGTNNGGTCDFEVTGNFGHDCWSVQKYDTATIEDSACLHARNSNIRNINHLYFRRNRLLNQLNHGQVLTDVHVEAFENNWLSNDTATSPNNTVDDYDQGDIMDSYCVSGTFRNNSLAMRNKGREGFYFFNNGAGTECADGLGPDLGVNIYGPLKIYNNLFFNNDPASPSGAISFNFLGLSGAPGSTQFSSRYNYFNDYFGTLSASNGTGSASLATIQATYDYDGDGVKEEVGSFTGAHTSTQLFADYANFDFRPAAGSPLINAGIGDATYPCPTDDFNGAARSDGQCDIGAFEFVSGGPDVCGDGSATGVETCDDGDTVVAACVYGDGPPLTQVCDSDCIGNVDCASPQYCADSAVNGPETCDDGNATVNACSYGDSPPLAQTCDSDCIGQVDCSSPQYCADSVTNGPETCDDGNTSITACVYNDSPPFTQVCDADCVGNVNCLSPQYCSDGAVNGPETCDDSNTAVGACAYGDAPPFVQECDADCIGNVDCASPQWCGDSAVNGAEQCDSGIGGATCGSLGYAGGGTLSCSGACLYDTSLCLAGAAPPPLTGGGAVGRGSCFLVTPISIALTGTTRVDRSITVTFPVVRGSVDLLLTGDQATGTMTTTLRDARFNVGEADMLSLASTITSGRAVSAYPMFSGAIKTSALALPPTAYVLGLVSTNAASTGTVSGVVTFSCRK